MKEKKGVKINMDIEDLVSGLEEIEEASKDIYSVAKSDKDINLFHEVYSAFDMYDEDSSKNFKKLIFKNNPNIENLNDLVQQLLISFAIITYLLKLKGKQPNVSILDIISSIKYGAERKDWLFLMKERVIPYMAVNKLI